MDKKENMFTLDCIAVEQEDGLVWRPTFHVMVSVLSVAQW